MGPHSLSLSAVLCLVYTIYGHFFSTIGGYCMPKMVQTVKCIPINLTVQPDQEGMPAFLYYYLGLVITSFLVVKLKLSAVVGCFFFWN